jgi:outer membrane biogenesis lipoprotein LolB
LRSQVTPAPRGVFTMVRSARTVLLSCASSADHDVANVGSQWKWQMHKESIDVVQNRELPASGPNGTILV